MELVRPKSQELQKESFLAIEGILNKENCEFRRIEPDNSGIDGEVQITENRRFLPQILKCQIKAGPSYISSENDEKIVVKVEKRYLEHWNQMNVPVILFYYKNSEESIYWKSIQEYLLINKPLLKKDSQTLTITFDKERDIFDKGFLTTFKLIIERKFEYEKYIFSESDKELLLSNWFEVLERPAIVFKSPTAFIKKRQVTNCLNSLHSFIIKEGFILTFSNLFDTNCELRKFCDANRISKLSSAEIPKLYFAELLNSSLIINALMKGLIPKGDKFYMSEFDLNNGNTNEFGYKPLIRNSESHRKKVYVSRNSSGNIEYKHHALKMKFQEVGEQLFFEIEPDWHFSYPNDKSKTPKDIGIRVTKEKAGMYNKDYLYLLHALKQFLSDGNNNLIFKCNDSDDSQKITICIESLSTMSNFRIFNDYITSKNQGK